MKMKTGVRELRRALVGLSTVAMLAAAPAHAQLSSATIKGQITQSGAPAAPATPVVASNTATGYNYRTSTGADGSYVLTGLPPGEYAIKVGGQSTDKVTLSIGQTASLDLSVGAANQANPANMAQVVILGSAQRRNVKTSEVGTSVSRAQIESLPQVSRNFLAFADLAPGVRFDVEAKTGYGTLQGGAQNQDNVNVFIDGVGQKNYILRGGMSGLDSSRGNPFPQSAVAEYKVVSQNYKAEFDQVSSTAITAITKSGTNQLHGDVFFDRTGANLTAHDPFQKKNKADGVERPRYSQKQYGATLGGPIKEDVMHYFIAYEGKRIDTPRQVVAQRQDLLPNAGIVPSLLAQAGSTTAKFKEDLVLGKLTTRIGEDHLIELTTRVRRENDLVPEDFKLSVPGNEKDRKNDETRIDLKHEFSRGDFLNEARIGYEKFHWNPSALLSTPYVKYVVSPSNETKNVVDVLFTGGSPDAQDRMQKGLSLSESLTWTGLAGHTIKGGVKVKKVDFKLYGTSNAIDIRREMIDNVTGIPQVFEISRALAPTGVSYTDRQYGVYLQDDWKLTKQLELNLGLRWDYETNMLNDSYVTPSDRAGLFGKQDPRAGAPVGQTYAQSLAKGGVTIGNYISTGSNRKSFKDAWQPRVGLSYDLFGDSNTVFFAGAGRAYDRTIANVALDELQKNSQAGGEIWLVRSEHKLPYTDQFSVGVRQALGAWNTELGATVSRSRNQFNWFGGNRDVNGGWGNASPIDPMFSSVPGYGTLILGDFISQAKTSSAYLKGDKPFSTASGWGLAATYTYSEGETTNKEWNNDMFNWTFGRYAHSWNPSTTVERHRLVVAGLSDRLLPFGIMLSSKVTLGSGLPYRITDCSMGFEACVSRKGDGGSFRTVDMAMAKDLGVGFGKVSVRFDVLNVFNTVNYAAYDAWGGGPTKNNPNYLGGDNVKLGVPGAVTGPMRTVKLTARYAF
ncbi:TonB-dependent receptor [Massilia violaceinigra]|uniref:TonB-dependent receptor n=1 Tax=Massilia violaceinigra TaxID=2045208 RepID=A0ABY4A5D2_9BURK|nr:TonB-dependent receptor [Massilia violaceinigra]UOD29990.1 TonB-dependent receptor [Massilia violaceinigra]